jgi:alpha-glucosidase
MSGRYAHVDLNSAIARSMRWTMFLTKPDAFLLAEHFFDATRDLTGDGWHGVMNYAGFARPVLQWLAASNEGDDRPWFPVLAPTSGVIAYLTMRDYMAAVPWTSALNNFNLLDSHDTARFATIASSKAAARVGLGLMMSFVGIPMLFAGDEIGLEGQNADDSRRPMPWDGTGWDGEMLDWCRRMIAVRRSSPALCRGGMRWVTVGDDVLAFVRETRDERVLVCATRREAVTAPVDAGTLGARTAENLIGGEALEMSDGKLRLPATGPAFNVWRLGA